MACSFCPHSSLTRWYAVPRKASPVASVWRVCGAFWIHRPLVFSCTILNTGSGTSKNMMIKALRFFTWTLEPSSLRAIVRTQSKLMCQDTAILTLVNTLACISVWVAWYANWELESEFGDRRGFEAKHTLVIKLYLGQIRPINQQHAEAMEVQASLGDRDELWNWKISKTMAAFFSVICGQAALLKKLICSRNKS